MTSHTHYTTQIVRWDTGAVIHEGPGTVKDVLEDGVRKGVNFFRASLNRASLNGASLNRASLNGASLNRASLNDASLNDASLNDASLNRAWLDGTMGNMREIKSAHFDTWPITWATAPTGTVMLQIGCQRHDLELWRKADPRWIAAMAPKATEWWSRYGTAVLALVDASPAVPWGERKEAA